MHKKYFLTCATVLGLMASGHPTTTHASQPAHDIVNPDGKTIGHVMMKETEKGVLFTINASGMDAGSTHAIHIHETGKCTPDFKAAGGHFNPAGHNHGMMDAEGMHAGDMPNLHADESGNVKQEILNTMVTTKAEDNNGKYTLNDADGSALIIHAGADDYTSQPTGEAGDRIGCAVLAAPKE